MPLEAEPLPWHLKPKTNLVLLMAAFSNLDLIVQISLIGSVVTVWSNLGLSIPLFPP